MASTQQIIQINFTHIIAIIAIIVPSIWSGIVLLLNGQKNIKKEASIWRIDFDKKVDKIKGNIDSVKEDMNGLGKKIHRLEIEKEIEERLKNRG